MNTDLELDPFSRPNREVYQMLTALVVPRPIAWISTIGPDDVRNLAPHSYFNLISHDPPHVGFSTTAVRDTLTNIRAGSDFVVNMVSRDLLEPMNLTAAEMPAGEDEFGWAGLEAAPSARVRAPRVARAKAHLECRPTREVAVGRATLVIGEIVHVHIGAGVWRDGRIDPRLLDPVCRLAGSAYATLGELIHLPRPTWTGQTGEA